MLGSRGSNVCVFTLLSQPQVHKISAVASTDDFISRDVPFELKLSAALPSSGCPEYCTIKSRKSNQLNSVTLRPTQDSRWSGKMS